ncbi:trichoplein keratin filament-binding protein-like isoform X2 [Ostrinia furnacalis]|uniref:trichoplein keratin filament-binding protein-like isoform X1 n=1 Tax=Ostrinia furnacalis TaxID=93504 RepID=UPI001040768A|nr:trichoplein keratin filament-binding protein-like isoform X1 [Ostrinia furnacalis]XP_028176037.1 trichoplein keratin filament-binding protein-like isoform X1 [Ostrinia furnacalis]XP_028176038.1 trichoplein keratin filament-binding protein-like isoform X1 [Ostrinia furnacalis]XP_028176039.1 trichoplein keratin filament-binding protein-like isoform X2 [Ostrinia furnacalis]
MSRPVVRPQWQLAALAAQRRDNELRKAEELKKIANYFEANTNKSRHHEQWTTEGYYEKANKEAVELSERKIRAAQLEERRKKLELMLFQENMQYQQELKTLGAQPKYYKNGSYLNKIPTSTLQEINQGIMAKEEQLRRHEAELRLHHAWRLRQPELRAASSYIAAGKCKSAWLEQIVEKEMKKKKEEEENIKILQERDEALRRQIQIEEDRLRDKERQMRELREGLEGQIAEFSEKESIVNKLRKAEEREKMILDELQFISSEREKEHARLVAERDANIVNMGLHKYKLKRKVISVLKEIELDLDMLAKIRRAVVKDLGKEQEKSASYKRVLDTALRELEEYKDKERQRQKNIEAMYDGEARQINEKQDKLWAKERDARSILMNEVISTLRRQLEEKIEANRQQQKENVLEREKILEDMDGFHQEVRSRERETQLKNATYSTMASLQSQLNSLRVQQQQAAAASDREAARREACARERRLRHEIARAQRTHSAEAWT